MPKGIKRYSRLRDLPGMLSNTEGDSGGGVIPAAAPTGGDAPATGGDTDGDADETGKGGKSAILADLARERDKRQAVEAELQKFREAAMSEQEKALDGARKEAREAALRESAPRLVSAEFRAVAAGRMTADQLSGFLEDLDLTKYLTDAGEVDTERVAKKVDLLAPAGERKTAPSFGGGARLTADKPDPGPGLSRLRDAYANPSK